MSYLNVPRLHFSGSFQADPSTVNNNDSNYDPTVQLSNEPPDRTLPIANTSVYWNPNGTHNWIPKDCTVLGAADAQGPFSAPSSDRIIGAKLTAINLYPAKIVDLDPDNQNVSQIYGLTIQVSITDPTDPTNVLASVAGTMPPTAFCDLWNRGTDAGPSTATMSAAFQAVLEDIVWVNPNPKVSPLLTALQIASPNALSIRFIVDSFQADSNQENFTFGRLVGTIGPVLPDDAPRSTPRRLAPASFTSPAPSIMSVYGPAGATWDSKRQVLILDLGNCVPSNAAAPSSGPSIPIAGWPIENTTFQLTIPGPSVNPNPGYTGLKTGAGLLVGAGAPSVLGTIGFSLSTYLTYAGIVEVSVSPALAPLLARQPMTLTDISDPTAPMVAAKEDYLGRYVDVDVPFVRMNPNETAQVVLWATLFGKPWNGAALDVVLLPPQQAGNGPTQEPYLWQNGAPSSAVSLSSTTVVTQGNGTGALTLTAQDPGTPRMYPDGQLGPDGQVYWLTGEWAAWGQIFLFTSSSSREFTSTPINLLVFSGHSMPAAPTWTSDVGPILSNYARMYPYMKSIIDLSDYATVVANATAIKRVLNLPPTDPHHMPIVRDLSRDKLAMINQWFANEMPR